MSSTMKDAAARVRAWRPGDGAGRADLEGPRGDLVARRAHLTVTRISPWSVCKVAFMLSVALGIMGVIASIVLWFLLDSMHVFAAIQDLFVSVGSESFGSLIDYVQFSRVLSVSVLIAIVNAVLLTALATLLALLYNLVADLVGGLKLTLTDD